MITESVVLPVRPGFEAAFERAFRAAESLIARQSGYLSHSLKRGMEDPSTYLLTVEWETVEDHEVAFRGSADYQEWRAILHPFYDPVPTVCHYGEDLAGDSGAWGEAVGGADGAAVVRFWERCRDAVPGLPEAPPEAWAFGSTRAQADRLLELVLAGAKTGTASSLWDYEEASDPVPSEGEYSIILDGTGTPRCVIETTGIRIVPFDEVTEEHAASEGEGDRTLAHWREVHARYFAAYAENPRGFEPDMPVVCERFRLTHGETQARP